MDKERCSAKVRGTGRFGGSINRIPCKLPVKADGFCRVHHPAAQDARSKKSLADWKSKCEEAQQKSARRAAREKALDAFIAAATAFVEGYQTRAGITAWAYLRFGEILKTLREGGAL